MRSKKLSRLIARICVLGLYCTAVVYTRSLWPCRVEAVTSVAMVSLWSYCTVATRISSDTLWNLASTPPKNQIQWFLVEMSAIISDAVLKAFTNDVL